MDSIFKKLVDASDRAIIIYNRKDQKILYANPMAISVYGDSDGTIDVRKLYEVFVFQPYLFDQVNEALDRGEVACLNDVTTRDNHGEDRIADVQFGCTNEEKTELFLRLSFTKSNATPENVAIPQELLDAEELLSSLPTHTLDIASFQAQATSVVTYSSLRKRHALFFIHINDLKDISDGLGEDFEAHFLDSVAEKLKKLVRGHDLVGRMEDGRFVVFLESCGNRSQLQQRGTQIIAALHQDFTYHGSTVSANTSIGISIYPTHGTTYDALYQNASHALRQSKDSDKSGVTIFSENLN